MSATYNGVSFGYGYGNYANYHGSLARNSSYQRDPVSNGNSVFVDTKNALWYPTANKWEQNGAVQTDRTSSSSWTSDYTDSWSLSSTATKSRGTIKVCEDAAWRPDICSVTTIATFSY